MIFVTGGTGFLGTHLLRELIKGEEPIRALRRPGRQRIHDESLDNRIEWVEGDVLDIPSLEEAMNGCSKVYHCAAKVSFRSIQRERLMKVNAEGTANVVNVALAQKNTRLLHVSSVAAIGRTSQPGFINEEIEWEDNKLNSNYAISKYLAEREVWRGIAEGLDAVIVNPSLVLGSGNWHTGTPRFFLNVWKGMPFYVGGGTGMVDVKDVARCMVQLFNSGISAERFIINAENISYRNLFNTIADLLGKKRPYLHAPPWIAQIAWRTEAIRSSLTSSSPYITRETARISGKTFAYDNAKIKMATAYEFTPISTCLEEAAKLFLADVQSEKIK